jgi:8-oxo-dGTP pyrophosphatase MutT (NUDIX family)
VRELREETGIRVSAAQVGDPSWRRTASFRHRELRHLQHEVVVQVRLDVPGTAIDEGERLDYEKEDYFDFRWWSIGDVLASAEPFYPRSLPALLQRFLDGESIDEPFELWS